VVDNSRCLPHYRHICHVRLGNIAQATQPHLLCEIFWTQQKREMVRGNWASAELGGGTAGSRSSGGFDWTLFIPETAPQSQGWGLRSAANWRVLWAYVPVSLRGYLLSAHGPAGRPSLQILSWRLRWLRRPPNTYGVCARTGCSCAVSP
jgi:hypothetical protein